MSTAIGALDGIALTPIEAEYLAFADLAAQL